LLKVGGVLASLVRTESSSFHLADSLTLAELETQLQQETFEPISPEIPLQHLPAITLTEDDARRWCLGQRLSWEDALPDPEKDVLRVDEEGGDFLGIGQMIQLENEWLLAPKLVFAA
jgi:tRNA pseudouridine55 synthase